MDINSMMSTIQAHQDSSRLATGLTRSQGNGMTTSATAIAAKAATGTAASGSASATSSTSNTGTISSNDFLTLLVTEMKNQDPTQPTDPNAYIQQLVGVNSLQQLISINQELGTATGATTSGSSVRAVAGSSPSAIAAATAAPIGGLYGS